MKEDQERERRNGALMAAAVLGWEVCAGLAKSAMRIFLEKAKQPPAGSSAETIRKSEEEERRKAETGAVLMLAGVVGWRIGKSVVRKIGEWLLSGPRGPRGGTGAPTIEGGFVAGRRTASAVERKKPAALEVAPEQGREADRNLDAEHGVNLAQRARWGTGVTGFAFCVSVAGGLGFLVTYWTGGPNELLGGMLALFFGGMGVTAVGWGRWLTVQKEATAPREDPSSWKDHDAATETFAAGAEDIQRRKLLGWMAAGGLGVVGAMLISMFRSLGASPDTALYTRVWKRGQKLMTLDGKPVKANALPQGSTTLVFPEDSIGSEKTQTVLIRVNPALLRLPPDRADWAPMGNVAYSRVCTHAGCSVGMYETTTHQLMCPCHQSTFDVLRGAMPTGGPAARALPQLPLYTDSEGNLCAGGGLSAPPGPGFWGIPA